MPTLPTLFLANRASKQSHFILVGPTDNYFKNSTTVTLTPNDPSMPPLNVLKVLPVGPRKRHLLVRYEVRRVVKGAPGDGDLQSGTISVTVSDPPATSVVAVAFVEDDGAP